MNETLPLLEPTTFPAIIRRQLQTLQINIGLRCNLACLHCHTNSNPYRKEAMSAENIDLVIDFLRRSNVRIVDITGGAPELHPQFRDLISRTRDLGVHVMDRSNLTVLEEPGQGDLSEFLADHQVEVVASLPCYTEDNVDGQRGKGVFASSIRGLQTLNRIGYGQKDTGLVLNLVYNPLGPFLPPSQIELERVYRKELRNRFDIVFNELFTLCNMPINRFGSTLVTKGQFKTYMALLRSAHRTENLEQVMCRSLLSVDWQGYVYDCDFNQMLGLNISVNGSGRIHLSQILGQELTGHPIRVREHCYGCTAGQGSSCGGALS
jgi:radical SAM/Cys-rich protein